MSSEGYSIPFETAQRLARKVLTSDEAQLYYGESEVRRSPNSYRYRTRDPEEDEDDDSFAERNEEDLENDVSEEDLE
jgi:hypothetical protein